MKKLVISGIVVIILVCAAIAGFSQDSGAVYMTKGWVINRAQGPLHQKYDSVVAYNDWLKSNYTKMQRFYTDSLNEIRYYLSYTHGLLDSTTSVKPKTNKSESDIVWMAVMILSSFLVGCITFYGVGYGRAREKYDSSDKYAEGIRDGAQKTLEKYGFPKDGKKYKHRIDFSYKKSQINYNGGPFYTDNTSAIEYCDSFKYTTAGKRLTIFRDGNEITYLNVTRYVISTYKIEENEKDSAG